MFLYTNALADVMADRAAELSAITPMQSHDLEALDTKVAAVQHRLVEVAARTWGQRQKVPQGVPQPLEAPAPSLGALHTAKKFTTHLLAGRGKKLRCKRCLGRASEENLIDWLGRPCGGQAAPPGVHPTHSFELHRGLGFCSTCGVWTLRKLLFLSLTCQPPTGTGRQNLSRIRRGLPPQGCKEWPEPEPNAEARVRPVFRKLVRSPTRSAPIGVQ